MRKFISVGLLFVFISLSGCAYGHFLYKIEQYKIDFAVVDADAKLAIENAAVVIDDGKNDFVYFTGEEGKAGVFLFYGGCRAEIILPIHIPSPPYYPTDFNIWIIKEGYESQNIRLQKSDFALTDKPRNYRFSKKVFLKKKKQDPIVP